ncbi:MAG: hypothetical protein EHM34_04690, partial [Nitrosopumilales archaeon]
MLGLDTSFSLQGKDVLSTFLDMQFWIWDPHTHRNQYATEDGYCCFNHVLSLPSKDGVLYPLFRFQKIIFDILEQNQNVWIKKARGLGLTTLILRYLAWKIIFSSELDYKSIYIIAGNGNKSNHGMDVMLKKLFEKRFPSLNLDSKFTDLWLKKTRIKILDPTDIIDLTAYDIAYLFIDDADFLEPSEQINLEQVISSCSVRSNCRTIMVSTPNQRGGLFEKIENDETSGYTKLKLDYRYGIG